MKRFICHAGVTISLTVLGCASPVPIRVASPQTVTSSPAVDSTHPAVTAVAYQNEAAPGTTRLALPEYQDAPTITPAQPYSATQRGTAGRPGAPVQSGNVFLPAPEIPAAPSVAWPATQSLAETTPLTLSDVEELACQNNPTLLQARAQVQGAVGRAIQAGLWPNPTLIYSAEQIGVEGTAGEFHGGIVRQRIVTAHKLDLSRQKYLQRTQTAQWVALAQQYRVLNDVRMHYFRARGRQEIVDVQQQLLKNAEDHVVTFREMYNVGQATRAEVHQANVRLQTQRLNLLIAENDFRQAFEELTAMTGLSLPESPLETPLAGELALIDWHEALYRLLEESPQIAAARSKLEADRLAIRREIAEPVPDIIVEGGTGYNFEANETVGMAAVMMEVPVFDWNQGTIRQAEADHARQQGELRRTELLLRQQLAQQYRNYLTAVQQVRNYEQVVLPEAKLAYDLQLQSYEEDRLAWPAVLASEQDFFLHRVQYITSLIAWRENEVSIMGFLLHGGLSDPPSPMPAGHIDAVPQPR